MKKIIIGDANAQRFIYNSWLDRILPWKKPSIYIEVNRDDTIRCHPTNIVWAREVCRINNWPFEVRAGHLTDVSAK